jgi:hypothetical protein
MAMALNSIFLQQVKGQIGKQIVVKRYGQKTVITAYPDMSRVKPSKLQRTKRKDFAAAVAYARSIINDPEQKAAYAKRVKKGERVYNFAIKEYLRR